MCCVQAGGGEGGTFNLNGHKSCHEQQLHSQRLSAAPQINNTQQDILKINTLLLFRSSETFLVLITDVLSMKRRMFGICLASES